MTTRAKEERDLEALRALGRDPGSAAAREGLGAALRSRRATLVAAAARVVATARIDDLGGDVVAAFERLCDARDPGALGKTACVQALLDLAAAGGKPVEREVTERVLLPASRLRQWEPVYGGRADVAGPLRALAATGLLERGDARVWKVLVDHLADDEAPVRQAAARNLGARGGAEALLALRLKARLGDREPRVLGDVLRALLAVDPEDAVAVAALWLEDAEAEPFGEAAVALGASRAPGVFAVLREAWERTLEAERRRLLLAAMGLVRSEEAAAFLIATVRDAGPALAAEAIRALAAHAHDPEVRRLAGEAVAARSEEEVRRAWEESFEPA